MFESTPKSPTEMYSNFEEQYKVKDHEKYFQNFNATEISTKHTMEDLVYNFCSEKTQNDNLEPFLYS